MSTPLVAICIPTFNQAAFLTDCVTSALAQTFPDVEVWVSDDCSTDETPEVLSQLQQQYGHLKAIRQNQNIGISANNNWLLSQPRAKYIARLDSDDILHPNYIASLVDLLERYPTAGYAHCAIHEINQYGAVSRTRRLGSRAVYQTPEETILASISGYRVAANICLFRQQALREAGFYREGMRFCEDWDLAVRLADAGWGNVYQDEVLACYRVWDNSNNVRARRKMDEINGGLLVYERTLIPAFERRGWNMKLLHKARQNWVIAQSVALLSPAFSALERKELTDALRAAGGSPALEHRLRLYRFGFGSFLLQRNQLILLGKDAVKAVLRRRQK